MRYCIFIILTFSLTTTACGKKIPASAKTDVFEVSGNCGMCKKTIEKSVKVEGIYDADWNKKTKMITVSYDTTKISLDEIKKLIAKAGYDNDSYKADSSDYDGLHDCCKYDRE